MGFEKSLVVRNERAEVLARDNVSSVVRAVPDFG